MKIGAQLFTVHDYTKSLTDLSETLKKIADIGYTSVQISGTCEYEPEWLAQQLKSNGLTCDITHYKYEKMLSEPEKVVADHKIFNCKYIGIGCLPYFYNEDASYKDVVTFAKKIAPAAKRMSEAGGYLMCHNHASEFKTFDGKICIESLAELLPASDVGFTLDVYWVKAAGYNPVEWLNRLKGRTPCIHLKDLITMSDKNYKYAEVGSGELDFDSILKCSVDNDVKYAFVEQDDCYGKDPFECLKTSFKYLKSKGFC